MERKGGQVAREEVKIKSAESTRNHIKFSKSKHEMHLRSTVSCYHDPKISRHNLKYDRASPHSDFAYDFMEFSKPEQRMIYF